MSKLTLRITYSLIVCALLRFPVWAQEIPLTTGGGNRAYPQWSPDENWIVYEKFVAGYGYEIYKVSAAGGTEISLTSDAYDHLDPQWSPDGNWVVYHKQDATNCYQIYKTASVGIEEKNMIHSEFQNPKVEVYPNPFITEAIIRYSSNGKCNDNKNTSRHIYDVSGRLVELTKGSMIGKNLKSGIYFLKTDGCKMIKIVKLR